MATETYQLVIDGNLQGSYRSVVMHFTGTGLTANDTAHNGASLVAGWEASIQALFLACLPQTYTIGMLSARRVITKPSVVTRVQFAPFSVFGTRGSNAVAQNLCPVVFLVPGMGVKSGGKVFLPAVSAGDVVNNGYLAAFITAGNAAFNAMIAGFANAGITWSLAIYSKKLNAAFAVSSFTYSKVIGYQGKRRKPVGQ